MRRAVIDYLLSDDCPYTSYELLLLFVLDCAIKANRENISKKDLLKATGMHRNSLPKNLKSLSAKGAIALEGTPDAPVYVIKDEQLVRVKRGTEGGGTIGGGVYAYYTK